MGSKIYKITGGPDNQISFLIRSSLFDRQRMLTIHPDYLALEDNDLNSSGATRIEKEHIEGFRFGIDWYRGRYIMIGRTYRIEVRDHQGRILGIRLHSIYGIHQKRLGNKFRQIYQALHKAYFNDLGLHYIRLVNDGLSFSLGGVTLTNVGIEDPKIGALPWNSIGLKPYHSYFALYDKAEPAKYHAFDYGFDWNAGLLYAVLNYILKHQK